MPALTTRAARPGDASLMVALLNPIIARGGTTAHQRPYDAARMTADYISAPLLIRCTLALEGDELVGFQALERADPKWDGPDPLPEGWAVIASFVKVGAQGRGIGQALWAETRKAAQAAAIPTIDATIRADNVVGLAYYSGLGFVDYDVLKAVPLRDGTRVDRIRKRYDLNG